MSAKIEGHFLKLIALRVLKSFELSFLSILAQNKLKDVGFQFISTLNRKAAVSDKIIGRMLNLRFQIARAN